MGNMARFKSKGTLTLLVAIIVLLAVVYFFTSNNGSPPATPSAPAPNQVYSPTAPLADQKVVCIVLDDGWKTHLDAAAILDRYNFTASFPVITSYVGYPAYLSWNDIATLAQKGNDIVSQTSSHVNLSAVNTTALNSELADSRQTLRTHGYGADILIYPYGEATHNKTVTDKVAKIYQAAVGLEAGKTDISTQNRFNINSYIISNTTTLDQFAQILSGTGGNKITVLSYGKIGEGSISSQAFEAQMQYLSSNGYTVETLSQLLLKTTS
jgi:peptidoglycan/xylan/chitin deacetylase (PgdA/CDA1 family)